MFPISESRFVELLNEPPVVLEDYNLKSGRGKLVYEKLKSKSYEDVLRLIKSCRSCSIYKESITGPILPQGSLDASCAFIGRNPGCVSNRTLIQTSVGKVQAYKIKSGDSTFSYSELGGIESKRVIKKFINSQTIDWMCIYWRGGKLGITPNHSVYTTMGRVLAGDLHDFDRMYTHGNLLSRGQDQILLGTLLGDSLVFRDKRSITYCKRLGLEKPAYIEFYQSKKQWRYLKWKLESLSEFLTGCLKEASPKGFGEKNGAPILSQITKVSEVFNWYYNQLYKTGRKRITEEYLEKMDLLAWAVWIMDDGSYDRGAIRIGTNNFEYEDLVLIQEVFKRKFGLLWRIYKKGERHVRLNRECYSLGMGRKESLVLIERLRPYFVDSMAYKLGGGEVGNPVVLKGVRGLIPVSVKVVRGWRDSSDLRYDFEVEDNHNYFAGGLLVSNSKEMESGIPFHPKAPGGSLFMQYLARLGLSREEVYITNTCFCYTKHDRPPEFGEVSTCTNWKYLELSYLKNLKFLFLLGNDALRSFTDPHYASIMKWYGRAYQVNNFLESGRSIVVFPVMHPGYILRNRGFIPLLNKHLDMIKQSYLKGVNENSQTGL